MGAAISTNVSRTENEIISKAVNQCKRGTASNELYLKGITHDPAPTCKNPTFSVQQSAVVDADCFINALQNNMADTIKKMQATTQAGFGIAGSTNIDEGKQKINAALTNSCGGVSATQVIDAKDITSRACDMTFIQNATAQSKCKIDALQDAALKTESNMDAGATGASLASILFGSGSSVIVWIIGLVVVLGIIGGIGYYMQSDSDSGSSFSKFKSKIKSKKNKKKPNKKTDDEDNTQEGGRGKWYENTNYPLSILMVCMFLLSVFISQSKLTDSSKQLTPSDMLNFGNKVNELHLKEAFGRHSSTSSYNDGGVEWPDYNIYERAGGNNWVDKDIFGQDYVRDPNYYKDLDSYYNVQF